jgi:hypothetical protein
VRGFFRTFLRTLLAALGGAVPEESAGDFAAQAERAVRILKDCTGDDSRRRGAAAVEEKKQFADALAHLAETVAGLEDSTRTVAGSGGRVGDFQMLMSTAESWVLLGFLQVALYADLGLMDPVVKRRLKLQYVSEEVGMVVSGLITVGSLMLIGALQN